MTTERILNWIAETGAEEMKALLKTPGLLHSRLNRLAEIEAREYEPGCESAAEGATQYGQDVAGASGAWRKLLPAEQAKLAKALEEHGAGIDLSDLNALLT